VEAHWVRAAVTRRVRAMATQRHRVKNGGDLEVRSVRTLVGRVSAYIPR
jgi:hypothetical protein